MKREGNQVEFRGRKTKQHKDEIMAEPFERLHWDDTTDWLLSDEWSEVTVIDPPSSAHAATNTAIDSHILRVFL